MAAWRMAFRVGIEGESLWPACRRLGVAAIGYDPLTGIDLSQHEQGEPKTLWSQLASSPRTSMRRFVFAMQPGDTIYVKQGPKIVGRGVVIGPYNFDEHGFVREKSGNPWQHQRSVAWHPDFPEVAIQLGDAPLFTVEELDADDLSRIGLAVAELGWSDSPEFTLPDEVLDAQALMEGAATRIWVNSYERNTAARKQCLAAHGTSCSICGFNFGAVFGSLAEGHIHVHHLRPLSGPGKAHAVHPVDDLRPVCPNCHGVLHLRTPAYSIEDVRGFLGR